MEARPATNMKMVVSIEIFVTRRMKRLHHLIEIVEAVMMMMIQWRSRSSNDPDLMMIHWWSRSSDDPDLMKMTWRWRWLDDDPDDTEKKTCADKLCRENTFLVKRECWCICSFGMYSLVYLMYCTPMFIPGSIYNVIESCPAPMFRSGDSIM